MVGITWYEALAFSRWLEESLQQSQGFPAWYPELQKLTSTALRTSWQARLPSEAEWEKAARGTDGWIYPWGNKPDPNRANYDDTKIGTTSAVGCFPGDASPYGPLDMSGNVWEWTRSLSEKYPYKVDDGRERLDAPENARRVFRGGSFVIYVRHVRCAFRDWNLPNFRLDLGFRVVVSPLSLASEHSGTLGLWAQLAAPL